MEAKQLRILCIETLGSFGLVFFSAGLVCINDMTAPQASHHPGIFGMALGQGLILAALLALTAPVTNGYLNPAITLMLWVFNRVETPRAALLIAAQFVGSVLAAVCLFYLFDLTLLKLAHFGAPHVNTLAYPEPGNRTRFTGAVLELLLTFFLVFAILGFAEGDTLKLGIVAGMITTVCRPVRFPVDGRRPQPRSLARPHALRSLPRNERRLGRLTGLPRRPDPRRPRRRVFRLQGLSASAGGKEVSR